MGLTTIGNVRRKIGEVRVRGSRDMLADQQTDRESHTHTHTHGALLQATNRVPRW